MNATLNKQKATVVKPPATIKQMAKLITLVAEQEPTSERVQQIMRLVPDMLNADLRRVNRYDFCRHIGRELPFKVHTINEITLTTKYGNFTKMLVELYQSGIIKNRGYLDDLADRIRANLQSTTKLSVTRRDNFLVVGCCNIEKLESFDLQPTDVYEFLAFEAEVHRLRMLTTVAGKCGSGWLLYSIGPTGALESVYDTFPDDRSYEEMFRYGNQDTPTLVRRIEK